MEAKGSIREYSRPASRLPTKVAAADNLKPYEERGNRGSVSLAILTAKPDNLFRRNPGGKVDPAKGNRAKAPAGCRAGKRGISPLKRLGQAT
jgi:hypothetical protein